MPGRQPDTAGWCQAGPSACRPSGVPPQIASRSLRHPAASRLRNLQGGIIVADTARRGAACQGDEKRGEELLMGRSLIAARAVRQIHTTARLFWGLEVVVSSEQRIQQITSAFLLFGADSAP
jgi:hypothetical protein